jgi:hypothetical protein
MQVLRACLAVLVATTATALAQSDSEIYTLYRNSVLDSSMRIHVASFDVEYGAEYNSENCNLAADLFQEQDSVLTRFWCEQGPYRP